MVPFLPKGRGAARLRGGVSQGADTPYRFRARSLPFDKKPDALCRRPAEQSVYRPYSAIRPSMVPSDSQVVTSSSQTSDRPEPLVVAMPYS